jgi:hypothetical protein
VKLRPLPVAAALVTVFVVAIVVLDRLAPAPGGPAGSSYATAPEGAAAYAELLRRAGHPVRRLRTPLTERALDPGTTLVVLDAARIERDEAVAIGHFVAAGGRLVAGGRAAWLREVLAAPPAWAPSRRGRATVVVPVPETAGVTSVTAAAGGRWSRLGDALPVLATPAGVVAAVARSGDGRAVMLADSSPLHNRALARDDSAAFGVAAAGGTRRPVAFLETVHGYGEASGLAALPARALWAIAALALAALALVWSMARRLGPPEDEARILAPPRLDYVEAIASALASSGDRRGIAEAAARAARRRLVTRAGLQPDAGDAALRDAAARFGLDAAETAAVLDRGTGDDLAAGRALAHLQIGRS